jgi:predicted glycosyltransferase
MNDKKHNILILVRDQGITCKILNELNIKYTIYGKASSKQYGKILQLPFHFIKAFRMVWKFHPDIFCGPGIIEAYISGILRKPLIAFWDSEVVSHLELAQEKQFIKVLFTPDCFNKDLGKKHVRLNSFKEFAYLHPSYFSPDLSILNELSVEPGERYAVLRFNAFDAVHDIGRKGFSLEDKHRLVYELGKYVKVFISPESSLPEDLKKYELPIPASRIHHALYYSQLLVGDTQTLSTEAAILGVPVIRCNNFVGPSDMGNFIELEQKYDLMYSFNESEKAIKKAIEIVKQIDIKQKWQLKRDKICKDKIDLTAFLVNFIENYPESFKKLKAEQAKI